MSRNGFQSQKVRGGGSDIHFDETAKCRSLLLLPPLLCNLPFENLSVKSICIEAARGLILESRNGSELYMRASLGQRVSLSRALPMKVFTVPINTELYRRGREYNGN